MVTELHSIVSDILNLVSDFQASVFVWIPRKKNMLADNLAKLALALNCVGDDGVIGFAVNAPN